MEMEFLGTFHIFFQTFISCCKQVFTKPNFSGLWSIIIHLMYCIQKIINVTLTLYRKNDSTSVDAFSLTVTQKYLYVSKFGNKYFLDIIFLGIQLSAFESFIFFVVISCFHQKQTSYRKLLFKTRAVLMLRNNSLKMRGVDFQGK